MSSISVLRDLKGEGKCFHIIYAQRPAISSLQREIPTYQIKLGKQFPLCFYYPVAPSLYHLLRKHNCFLKFKISLRM